MKLEFFVHTAFLSTLAIATSANGAESGQISRGHKIAERICAACHAVERNAARSPVSEAPPFDQIANSRAMTRLALRVALQSSHPVMPNVRLTEDERTDVVEYLISLKRLSVGVLLPPSAAQKE